MISGFHFPNVSDIWFDFSIKIDAYTLKMKRIMLKEFLPCIFILQQYRIRCIKFDTESKHSICVRNLFQNWLLTVKPALEKEHTREKLHLHLFLKWNKKKKTSENTLRQFLQFLKKVLNFSENSSVRKTLKFSSEKVKQ